MQYVWMLSHGSYDAWRISGIFSSVEKAQAYAQQERIRDNGYLEAFLKQNPRNDIRTEPDPIVWREPDDPDDPDDPQDLVETPQHPNAYYIESRCLDPELGE